jgi:methyl-accepting chemotaxis protein
MASASQPLSARKTREAVKVTREVVNRQGQALRGVIEHVDASNSKIEELEARVAFIETITQRSILGRLAWVLTGK